MVGSLQASLIQLAWSMVHVVEGPEGLRIVERGRGIEKQPVRGLENLMSKIKLRVFWIALLCPVLAFMPYTSARAQGPQALIQLVVDTERAANQSDHSNWTYLQEIQKPGEHLIQQVATTQQSDIDRVLERNGKKLTDAEQQQEIQSFLQNAHAQQKQVAEKAHDWRLVDDFLKLLPQAFLWSETGSNATERTLHFEPNRDFHPPSWETRVFSGMSGDVTIDNHRKRILSMSGHLVHDVTFGGGLFGRLKTGSSFSLAQAEVAPGFWQLTAIRVHLTGNAFLFKSVSLQQDDERSRFSPESPTITPQEAAQLVMTLPNEIPPSAEQ